MFDNDEMAVSESLEWQIENSYSDLQIKQFQFQQMQEAQRRAYQAEYEAEQRMYSDRARQHESDRKARAARVRANGGRWIQQADGSVIDAEGNILSASEASGSY